MRRVRVLVVAFAGCGLAFVGQPSLSQDVTSPAPAIESTPTVMPIVTNGGTRALVFRQTVGSIAAVQVVNTVPGFPITRLGSIFMSDASGGLCTATLIGPRVLLTAAHCISTLPTSVPQPPVTGTISNAIGTSQSFISGCRMAPGYGGFHSPARANDGRDDYALCQLSAPLPGIKGERLDLDAGNVLIGAKVLVAGFGCTNRDIDPKTGVIDRHTGSSVPVEKRTLRVGENAIAGRSAIGNLQVTGKIGGSGAIVCPGDSGGPTFVRLPSPVGSQPILRLVAVNSSVQGPSAGANSIWTSNLAPLSNPSFVTFLTNWVADQPEARKVCAQLSNPSHRATQCR